MNFRKSYIGNAQHRLKPLLLAWWAMPTLRLLTTIDINPCPMPHAQCPMPNHQRPTTNDQRPTN